MRRRVVGSGKTIGKEEDEEDGEGLLEAEGEAEADCWRDAFCGVSRLENLSLLIFFGEAYTHHAF